MHGGVNLKKFAVLFATIVCFAMISGSFAATNQNTENGLIKTQNYHKLVIVVPSNPTTGFKWVSSYDKKNVKLLSKIYVQEQPVLEGSGGYNVYTFYGKVGSKITLNHIGPGTKGKIVETKTYTII